MKFLYIDSRYNFLVCDLENRLMLSGGTRQDEQSFKDFLRKLFYRVTSIHDIAEEGYVGDGILIRIIDWDIMLNLSKWDNVNFTELSEQLFEYCTTNLHLNNYHFIDISCI